MKPNESIYLIFILTVIAAVVYTPLYLILTTVIGLVYYLVNFYSEQATVIAQKADITALQEQVAQLSMQVKQLALKARVN